MKEIRCHRCHELKPISEMRYDKDGVLKCASCRGLKEDTIVSPKDPFEKKRIINYQCIDCRYKFRRSINYPNPKCPCCGGTRLLKYERITADDILKLADDERI